MGLSSHLGVGGGGPLLVTLPGRGVQAAGQAPHSAADAIQRGRPRRALQAPLLHHLPQRAAYLLPEGVRIAIADLHQARVVRCPGQWVAT